MSRAPSRGMRELATRVRPGQDALAPVERLTAAVDLAAEAVAENHLLALGLAPHVAALEAEVLALVAARLESSHEAAPRG